MAKKKPQLKRRGARSIGSKKGKRKKSAKPKLTLKQRLARAKKLEALDAGKPVFAVSRKRALESQPQTRGTPSVVIGDSVGQWEKNAHNSLISFVFASDAREGCYLSPYASRLI